MDSYKFASLAYLVILIIAFGSWFFVSGRQNWNKTAQQAAIWGLIFLGVIAAYGMWNDISRTVTGRAAVYADEGRVVIPQSADGHYYLTLRVNGAAVEFVVDTGATDMVLSRADAQAAGLDPAGLAYIGSARTANGAVSTAQVRLDTVALGEIVDEDIRAVVTDGEMFGSLLGMGYLNLWQRIEFGDGQMVLQR
ncbi:TIGR02281 family clan AA aspartic protease [Alphaproteobacteria bacterium KMM 3653]|uniref:TIGR02281 family clan AA aspartic protease n=1 Tax=Harenicola maris TaxID=2841044 RepID=A0AAP2CMX6_9RHOB|nr:TIGR02281 family clan AA aspartic protease [Harenicola maris]